MLNNSLSTFLILFNKHSYSLMFLFFYTKKEITNKIKLFPFPYGPTSVVALLVLLFKNPVRKVLITSHISEVGMYSLIFSKLFISSSKLIDV